MTNSPKTRLCPNTQCSLYARKNEGNIVPHGFFKKKRGRARRFRCTDCGKSFCSSKGTPYSRLQHSRNAFDMVAAMSVEGVSKSSIARIMGLSWNTTARWEEKASQTAKIFNKRMTQGYELTELQADEIRTFTVAKSKTTWVFASIEVWSRLWASTVVGRRSYRNTRRLLSDAAIAGTFTTAPLITSDGFEFYAKVVRELFPNACLHGQVVKEWGKNRVRSITRSLVTGAEFQLDDALARSEDSTSINTSFIERLNLTIRRGCSYLHRRTPCHSRRTERLSDQLELLRCHYNFMRPHRSLQFGNVVRTPAMQTGLASKRLTFRMVFHSLNAGAVFFLVVHFEGQLSESSGRRKAA